MRDVHLGLWRLRSGVAIAGLMAAAVSSGLSGQEALDVAVERARDAWLKHAVSALVGASDTVRLDLPGVASAAAARPGQAARLIDQYVRGSEERELRLVQVRRLAADHAYAELDRTYVVRGTSEERRERLILGFRLLGGSWRMREVRITP